jgi:cytochrome b561
MGLKSTIDRYGSMAVSIHWLSAILVLVLMVVGFRAAGTVDPAAKAALLRLHLPIGIALLALTVLRIVWWRFDRRPDPIAASPHWQERAAQAVHILFYVVLLGMIASGIGMMVLSGASPIIFGGQGGALPDFSKYLPRAPHGIGAWLLIALVVLHVGAALYHQFGRRDGLLRRMWFGR